MLQKDLNSVGLALESLGDLSQQPTNDCPEPILYAIRLLQGIQQRNPEPDNAIPVRYFCYRDDDETEEPGFRECTESEFLEAEGQITYERHTVFENGCSQICLTKDPWADC